MKLQNTYARKANVQLSNLARDIEKFAETYDFSQNETRISDLLIRGFVEEIIEYLASFGLDSRKIKNQADRLAQRVLEVYYG